MRGDNYLKGDYSVKLSHGFEMLLKLLFYFLLS